MTDGDLRLLPASAGSAFEAANITPLTIMAAEGEGISRDVQPNSRDRLPFCSLTCQAATAALPEAFKGSNTQRRAPSSIQLETVADVKFWPESGFVLKSGVL